MKLAITRFPSGMVDDFEACIQTELSGDEQFQELKHETDPL